MNDRGGTSSHRLMALPLLSGAAGRLEPVEDGRFRRALLIPEGIAVRLPLVGENGEPADHPVADQAAQPVVASHLSRPGQQAVCRGVVAARSQSKARATRSSARLPSPNSSQSTTPVIRAPSVRTFDRFRSLWA